jgi:hypothetical protein
MVQWIDAADLDAPVASHLDVILYSREQIIKENAAMGEPGVAQGVEQPWGIISIKGQTKGYELPMQPITMMRNALGKVTRATTHAHIHTHSLSLSHTHTHTHTHTQAEGGSGVPLEKEKYMASVSFWREHVPIK